MNKVAASLLLVKSSKIFFLRRRLVHRENRLLLPLLPPPLIPIDGLPKIPKGENAVVEKVIVLLGASSVYPAITSQDDPFQRYGLSVLSCIPETLSLL